MHDDDEVDPVPPIVQRFPGPVVITTSRPRQITTCVAGAFFVALIAWAWLHSWNSRDDWNLFQAMAFAFAAIILIGAELTLVAALFLGLGSITLDAEGFEVRKLWTRLRRSWKDVDGFEAEWFQKSLRVTYINTGPATGALRVYQWIFGNREALSYTYGFGRSDFARLLTLWRDRALASSH